MRASRILEATIGLAKPAPRRQARMRKMFNSTLIDISLYVSCNHRGEVIIEDQKIIFSSELLSQTFMLIDLQTLKFVFP